MHTPQLLGAQAQNGVQGDAGQQEQCVERRRLPPDFALVPLRYRTKIFPPPVLTNSIPFSCSYSVFLLYSISVSVSFFYQALYISRKFVDLQYSGSLVISIRNFHKTEKIRICIYEHMYACVFTHKMTQFGLRWHELNSVSDAFLQWLLHFPGQNSSLSKSWFLRLETSYNNTYVRKFLR